MPHTLQSFFFNEPTSHPVYFPRLGDLNRPLRSPTRLTPLGTPLFSPHLSLMLACRSCWGLPMSIEYWYFAGLYYSKGVFVFYISLAEAFVDDLNFSPNVDHAYLAYTHPSTFTLPPAYQRPLLHSPPNTDTLPARPL